MNVCTLLQSSMKQPCIAMTSGKLWGLWHLSRQRVTWKPVTKWFVFFFSVLDSWLPYFRSTTRKNYILFDFRFLRDVAATYYNSALLNRQDSCRPCAPTYRWMSFRYQFFFTDINVFSCWLWHSNLKKHIRKVNFFDFVWCIKQIFSRRE